MSSKSIRTGLVTAVAFIAMEMALHGGLLSGMYQATPSLWRPEGEMKTLFPLMMVAEAFFGFFFGVIYSKGFEPGKGTVSQGLRFGFLMALMLAPLGGLVWYVVLPVSQNLGVAWVAGAAVESILLGLVAGAVYKG